MASDDIRHLTVTRRKGERVNIGGLVEIEVRQIRDDNVRLTIHAPAAIKVLRTELDEEDSNA